MQLQIRRGPQKVLQTMRFYAPIRVAGDGVGRQGQNAVSADEFKGQKKEEYHRLKGLIFFKKNVIQSF
jgi:hypothetical protein